MDPGWRLLADEIAARRRGFLLGGLAALGWAGGKTAVPFVVRGAVDRGISAGDGAALARWTALLVVVGGIGAYCAGMRRYLAFRQARAAETQLRSRLFAHLLRLDAPFWDRAAAGDLISRAASDLQQIQNALNMLPITIGNAVIVVAVTVVLVVLDPVLALCALVGLPVVNVLGRRFSERLHPPMAGMQRTSAALAGVVEETVSGIRVIKGLGLEPTQHGKLARAAEDVYGQATEAARVRACYVPAIELVPSLGLVAVLAVGGQRVIDGQLSVGDLVAFNVAVGLLIWPLRSLGFTIATAQRAAAAATRIAETLSATPQVLDPVDPVHLPPESRGELCFDAVTFAFDDGEGPVLDGFDLVVKPGETVALVGATGSGKSTVARLLLRARDVTGGAIRLDGVDLRDLPLVELRRAVAVVFEDVFLFTDSVAANLAFGRPDASREDVERAARLASAEEFIAELGDGYDTVVGERGFSLSGGQRQRLALARALVADPRLLVLDDATSAVDPAKEQEIRRALDEALAGRTTLVISHRPATIALADRVVLLDGGKVVAEGTHAGLLASDQRYRNVLAAAGADPVDDLVAG